MKEDVKEHRTFILKKNDMAWIHRISIPEFCISAHTRNLSVDFNENLIVPNSPMERYLQKLWTLNHVNLGTIIPENHIASTAPVHNEKDFYDLQARKSKLQYHWFINIFSCEEEVLHHQLSNCTISTETQYIKKCSIKQRAEIYYPSPTSDASAGC